MNVSASVTEMQPARGPSNKETPPRRPGHTAAVRFRRGPGILPVHVDTVCTSIELRGPQFHELPERFLKPAIGQVCLKCGHGGVGLGAVFAILILGLIKRLLTENKFCMSSAQLFRIDMDCRAGKKILRVMLTIKLRRRRTESLKTFTRRQIEHSVRFGASYLGKFAGNGRAGSDGRLQSDRTAEGGDGVFDDRKTKPRAAAGTAAAGGIHLIKPLENAVDMFGGDADAGVRDGQCNVCTRPSWRLVDRDGHASPAGREFDAVFRPGF